MTPPAFPQKRVLVVDDEPLVCDALKMMLEFDRHVVETVSCGKDALALLEKSKFDLVIVDYQMPGMKGDALAAAIKARNSKQPVVMITACNEVLLVATNPLTGVDSLINKPFLIENLRVAMTKVSVLTAEAPAMVGSPSGRLADAHMVPVLDP